MSVVTAELTNHTNEGNCDYFVAHVVAYLRSIVREKYGATIPGLTELSKGNPLPNAGILAGRVSALISLPCGG